MPLSLMLLRRLVCVTMLVGTACGSSETSSTVARVEVSSQALLLVGQDDSFSLSAQAFDAEGKLVPDAQITWASSNTDVIAQDGVMTARAELGSAQVTAQVGQVISAPVLVTIANPAAGVVLLQDSDFVSSATLLGELSDDPQVAPVLQASLSIATSVGDLVLSREGQPFGGRVTEVEEQAGAFITTVELVGVPTLFEDVRIERTAPWSTPSANTQNLRAGIGHNAAGLTIDDFNCSVQTGTNLGGFNFNLTPTFDDSQLQTIYNLYILDGEVLDFKAVAAGPFSMRLNGTVEIPAEVTATIECKAKVAEVQLVQGPGFFSIVSMEAFSRVNIGLAAQANVVAARLLVDKTFSGSSDFASGITYTGGDSEWTFVSEGTIDETGTLDYEFPDNLTDAAEVEIKPTFKVGLGSQAKLEVFDVEEVFEIAEWQGSIKAEAKLATVNRQVSNTSFAASASAQSELQYLITAYGITWMTIWLPGLGEVVGYFAEDIALPAIPLATDVTPSGTFMAPMTVEAGMPADMQINLQNVDGFGEYQVREVRIFEVAGNGNSLQTTEVASIAPDMPMQTSFRWTWMPQAEDVGEHRFAAFVVTELMPSFDLQVDANGVQAVTVTEETSGEDELTVRNVRTSARCFADAVVQGAPRRPEKVGENDDGLPDGMAPTYSSQASCTASSIVDPLSASSAVNSMVTTTGTWGDVMLSMDAQADVTVAGERTGGVHDDACAWASTNGSVTWWITLTATASFTLETTSSTTPPNVVQFYGPNRSEQLAGTHSLSGVLAPGQYSLLANVGARSDHCRYRSAPGIVPPRRTTARLLWSY